MRALASAALLFLAGCVTYRPPPDAGPAAPPADDPPAAPQDAPPYDAGPPPPQDAPPPQAPQASPAPPPAPARRSAFLTREQAIDAAFQVARERKLEVDTVKHAHLDQPAARWHVDLAGPRDGARLMLDARDGRLLKGRFRAGGEDAPARGAP